MRDGQGMNVGDTIYYQLREKERPVHPEKVWKGEVLKRSLAGVVVQCLDPGWQDFKDLVFYEQIVHVEKARKQQNHLSAFPPARAKPRARRRSCRASVPPIE